MKTKNKSLLGLCCFLSLAITACEAKELTASSPYPIIDSGVWAATSDATTNIYWIDNNRILFRTVKNNDKRLAYQGPFNLSIWEIGKGVTAYTPFAHRVDACLRDGIFRYTLEDEQKNKKVFYGKFGEEKPVSPPKMLYPYDLMNCRITDNPEIVVKRQNNRAIRSLLDRHGYLDIGAIRGKESSYNTFVTLYRPNEPEGKALPLLRFETIRIPAYYSFKNAYFISGYNYKDKPPGNKSLWPEDATSTIGWLYPDGKVEPLVFPDGPWKKQRGPIIVIPVKTGFFIVSHLYKSATDPGIAGGYYSLGGTSQKVISGSIYGTSVSPDGCIVAFSHAPYTAAGFVDDSARYTLKIINFCTEEKRYGQ